MGKIPPKEKVAADASAAWRGIRSSHCDGVQEAAYGTPFFLAQQEVCQEVSKEADQVVILGFFAVSNELPSA
jgi:hypothetical protein